MPLIEAGGRASTETDAYESSLFLRAGLQILHRPGDSFLRWYDRLPAQTLDLRVVEVVAFPGGGGAVGGQDGGELAFRSLRIPGDGARQELGGGVGDGEGGDVAD